MKLSVLIPDGESILLRNFATALSLIRNTKVFVMSTNKECAMRYSRYIHHFSFYPESDNKLDWINNINEELSEHKIDIIIPIANDGIESILKHKKQIKSPNKICLLPELTNFNIANNKELFVEHLLINNLAFPKSKLVDIHKLENLNNLKLPIIVKPVKSGGGGTGISIFYNLIDLTHYFKNKKLNGEYLAQEYIYGYDLGCSVLCKSGELITYTIQKVTLNDDNPFAPLLGVEFIDNKNISDIIKKLIKSLNWSGVAHIDLRFDDRLNEFKIIEINPRYWGSVESSLMAGVNFPFLHCLSSLDIDFSIPEYKLINYVNLKGLAKSVKKNVLLVFHIKFLFNNTPLKFILKDPLSNVVRFFPSIKRRKTS